MIVTNECRRTPQKIKEELKEMGIDISSTPILTAGVMTYNYLYDIISADKNKNTIYNVLTIGEEGLIEVMKNLDFLIIIRKLLHYLSKLQSRKIKSSPKTINTLII